MNVFNMSEESIQKLASDFNNSRIGRKIWLFSMIPQVVGFFDILVYLVMMLYGVSHPEIKEVVGSYILATVVILGIAVISYGFAKMMYWKQVVSYAEELNKIELMKKELETKVKKTKDKVTKDIKKKTNSVKKTVRAAKNKK